MDSAHTPTHTSNRKKLSCHEQPGGFQPHHGIGTAAIAKQSHASSAESAAPKRGAGYAVYDPLGQKIGIAEEVFRNKDGEPEYVRVRMGLFGMRSVLIPVQFVETDEESKTLVLR